MKPTVRAVRDALDVMRVWARREKPGVRALLVAAGEQEDIRPFFA
jgi:hypothetical protein